MTAHQPRIFRALLTLALLAILTACAAPTATETPTSTPAPSATFTVQPTRTRIAPEPSASPTAGPAEFFTAPDGAPTGDGSREKPWDLQTALNQPEAVRPGDTIWMLGGTYTGNFIARLKGEEGRPVTLRAMPGERATIDTADIKLRTLVISNTYWANYWGFEVTTSTNPRTLTERPGSSGGIYVDSEEDSHHVNFINLVVHDQMGQGVGFWRANTDSLIYGCLIYFNGVNQFDHGIYTQNENGEKAIIDNFIFDNASHGVHAYGSDSTFLNNYYLEGNTVFNNGSIGLRAKNGQRGGFVRNILIGGEVMAVHPVVINNYTYYPGREGSPLTIGYQLGSQDAVVQDNYLVGGTMEVRGEHPGMKVTGNIAIGTLINGLANSELADNNRMENRGSGVTIFVRPNRFEPERANITVYNFDERDMVSLGSDQLRDVVGLQPGDRYELHNVQDYYGDVITGTYTGQGIEIPMSGRTVAQPVGFSFKPDSTFPRFGGFVLISLGQD